MTDAATEVVRSCTVSRSPGGRVSMITVRRPGRDGCNRRTMNSSSRAVERQWMWRRSSPSTYGRRTSNSSLSSPRERRWTSLGNDKAPPTGRRGDASVSIGGCTTTPRAPTEGAATFRQSEAVNVAHDRRADLQHASARRMQAEAPGRGGAAGHRSQAEVSVGRAADLLAEANRRGRKPGQVRCLQRHLYRLGDRHHLGRHPAVERQAGRVGQTHHQRDQDRGGGRGPRST